MDSVFHTSRPVVLDVSSYSSPSQGSEVSFADEWCEVLPIPYINDIEVICRWENRKGYYIFVEKLLYIDLLEKAIGQLTYSDDDLITDANRAKETKNRIINSPKLM